MKNVQVFFDMTEVLLSASAKRIQYYGIARTVHEIGCNLAKIDRSVRFVVFSFGHGLFFEVFPVHAADGSVHFNIPRDVGQRWVRTDFGGRWFPTIAAKLTKPRLDRRNRRFWEKRASSLEKVQIEEGVLISAARPKLIADMIRALDAAASPVKVLPLLHDFMPLHRGATKRFSGFDRNFMIDNCFILKRADAVFTNSSFTTEEMLRFAAAGLLPQPPVTYTVPLVQQCAEGIEPEVIKLPTSRYVLTVGSNLGRKNIEVLFEALRMMLENGEPAPELVIAGAVRKRLRRYLNRPHFRKLKCQTRFVANPNQTDLVRLYTNALALVIPSRMEGWGLPAGEALWCGTLAICSTAPVFNEVCGELGLYFDPDQPDELAQILRRLMNDERFLTERRNRVADAKPDLRTWMDVAQDIYSALQISEKSNSTVVDFHWKGSHVKVV